MNNPDAIFAQAQALHQRGDLAQAEAGYRQILAIASEHAEAHEMLGAIALARRQPDAALEHLRAASRLAPNSPRVWFHLGMAHRSLGRDDVAIEDFRRAVALEPAYGLAQNALGGLLRRKGDLEDAATCYRAALSRDANSFDAHQGLGSVLQQQDLADQAEVHYRQALTLRPQDAATEFNLAVALYRQNRLGEAEPLYDRACQRDPANAHAFFHRGRVRQLQGRVHDSIADLETAVRLEPENTDAHYHLGMELLSAGDFRRGWSEFEWRLKTKFAPARKFLPPRWKGERLNGERILVTAEWGLGDTIQFLRFVPWVAKRTGQPVLVVQRPLVPLLTASGFNDVLPLDGEEEPDCQWQVPLLSLPLVFGLELDQIPASPYLQADARLLEHWQRKLGSLPGFKVGIHWRALARSWEDRRSIPVQHFAQLASLPGVTLVSLQTPPGRDELAALRDPFPLVDFADELDQEHGPFMDTAAIIKNLDLVISCDTSVAHLAGALGAPVWVAHMFPAEWRWLVDRDNSPWYPTMRHFRRTAEGGWDEVFARMAMELTHLAAAETVP